MYGKNIIKQIHSIKDVQDIKYTKLLKSLYNIDLVENYYKLLDLK